MKSARVTFYEMIVAIDDYSKNNNNDLKLVNFGEDIRN